MHAELAPPFRIKSLFFTETELVKCDIVPDRTSGSCPDPEILKTGPEDVCYKEGGVGQAKLDMTPLEAERKSQQ